MSNTGINRLRLAGAVLQFKDNSRLQDAGGYATSYFFSIGMSPQYGSTLLAALSVPMHAVTIFTQSASPNLSSVPLGTLKYMHLDRNYLIADVIQTQKDIRLWPIDALIAYVSELAAVKGPVLSARLSKILKETKDLPLPQRIESLVEEIRNLRFYKHMER